MSLSKRRAELRERTRDTSIERRLERLELKLGLDRDLTERLHTFLRDKVDGLEGELRPRLIDIRDELNDRIDQLQATGEARVVAFDAQLTALDTKVTQLQQTANNQITALKNRVTALELAVFPGGTP